MKRVDVEHFIKRTEALIRFVEEIPEEIDRTVYDMYGEILKKENEEILDVLKRENIEARFEAKETVRIVVMKMARFIREFEIGEDSTVKLTPGYGDIFLTVGDADVVRFPISPIIEYLRPLNAVAYKVADRIRGIECKVCYVETAKPLKRFEGIIVSIPELEYDISTTVKPKHTIDEIHEQLIYPEFPYEYKSVSLTIKTIYKKIDVRINHLSLDMSEIRRLEEMHETMVRGIIKIVERL